MSLFLFKCAIALLGISFAYDYAIAQTDLCRQVPPRISGEMEQTEHAMQYCFAASGDTNVLWLYGQIGKNSYLNVYRALGQTSRYHEVWIHSPGGFVKEAFDIGRELHKRRITLRVPRMNGVICVSACTILMLGAVNRTVDDGAQFMIHAKSGVAEVKASNKAFGQFTWGELIEEIRSRPENLSVIVSAYVGMEPKSSTEYVQYIQEVLGGTPNVDLYRRIADTPLPLTYGEQKSERDFGRDVAAIKSDGLIALQEILTQVELSSMKQMFERMSVHVQELGRGAKVALRIYNANLACRIQDLCLLERHQLENLGYHNFTRDVK